MIFPVLFKADLIFKDFSRKPSKFKYFSSLCEPCTLFDQEASKTFQQMTFVVIGALRVNSEQYLACKPSLSHKRNNLGY